MPPHPLDPRPLQTGLIALHSNRTEQLAEAALAWLGQNPLAPLEDEVVLVQSNGMAEWFKMEAAVRSGVCAAMRVELPSRFMWRTYRQVLGRAQVPTRSPVDKDALAWRLVRLLPGLLHEPGYEPVAGFLAAGRTEGETLVKSLVGFRDHQVHLADAAYKAAQQRYEIGLLVFALATLLLGLPASAMAVPAQA